MSDQTPPTGAPSAGDYPLPSTAPPAAPPVSPIEQPAANPAAPPVAPVAPPAPPYPNPPYAGGPYPGPQHPSLPAPNAGYPPAGMYPGSYPAAGAPAAAPAAKKPGGLGLVALLLALGAAVIAPIVGAVAAFQVGSGSWSWSRYEAMPSTAWPDLSFLSPVREWVLLGEIAFWAGTVLGIWAIVQGIVAIAKRRGLGTGIAAVVIAVVGLFIFGTVVYGAGIAGIATGASGSGIGV